MDWFQNFAISFQNDPILPEASIKPIIIFAFVSPYDIYAGNTGILNNL